MKPIAIVGAVAVLALGVAGGIALRPTQGQAQVPGGTCHVASAGPGQAWAGCGSGIYFCSTGPDGPTCAPARVLRR